MRLVIYGKRIYISDLNLDSENHTGANITLLMGQKFRPFQVHAQSGLKYNRTA